MFVQIAYRGEHLTAASSRFDSPSQKSQTVAIGLASGQ